MRVLPVVIKRMNLSKEVVIHVILASFILGILVVEVLRIKEIETSIIVKILKWSEKN